MTDIRTEALAKLAHLEKRLPEVVAEIRSAAARHDANGLRASKEEFKSLMEDEAEVIKVAMAMKLLHQAESYIAVKRTVTMLRQAFPADKYPSFPEQIDRVEKGLDDAFHHGTPRDVDWWIKEALTLPLPCRTQQRLPDEPVTPGPYSGLSPEVVAAIEGTKTEREDT